MSDHAPLNGPPHAMQEPGAGLRETQVASMLMRQGKLLTLKQDVVRLPDGRNANHEYLVHPDAVMMIPLFDDGAVPMERQFRYLVGKVMIELPAGKLDPQEGALACGKCELRRGTGYTVERQDYLTRIHPVTSYFTKFIDIYLTRDLKRGEAILNEGEFLETSITSAGQLTDQVRDGKISDMKAIIGTFWLKKILSGAWTPGTAQAARHRRSTTCFACCRYHSEQPCEKISTTVHKFQNQGYIHPHALDRS